MRLLRKVAKWRKRTHKLEHKNLKRGLYDWEWKLYRKLNAKIDEYWLHPVKTEFSIFGNSMGERHKPLITDEVADWTPGYLEFLNERLSF